MGGGGGAGWEGKIFECHVRNIVHCMKRHKRKPRMHQWRLLGQAKSTKHITIFVDGFPDWPLDEGVCNCGQVDLPS